MATTTLSLKYRPLRVGFLVREGSIEDLVKAGEVFIIPLFQFLQRVKTFPINYLNYSLSMYYSQSLALMRLTRSSTIIPS